MVNSPPIDASSRDTVFLARQPILDRAGKVYAYELLYRGTGADHSCQTSTPDTASARVLHGAVMNLGLETLTPECPAFVNATRTFLTDIGTLLPVGAVVLEVLETVDVDAEVEDTCRRLHEAGYAIALDDFVPGSSAERLFPYAQYLKVDVLLTDADTRRQIVATAPKHLRLLAEKVETAEMFADTLAEGFELFQGYYFCRPSTFQTRDMSMQQVASLRLLEALNRPDVTVGQVDELIKRDASICQRVLRYVNSAALGLSRPIHSIHHAVTLIGVDQIRRWVSIWSLAILNRATTPEVMTMAVVRARCCERLGTTVVGVDLGGELFLLGLCSLLDVLLERPMADCLQAISLPEQATAALLGHANVHRELLDLVIAFERAEWADVAARCQQLGLPQSEVSAVYADAIRWADEFRA